MNSTYSRLDRRAATILRAVRIGKVAPNSDALAELAEITMANEDAPVKAVVVARLTVTRANGMRTVVEIWADASFHNFYRYFRQNGARRSTKTLIRTASRNEGVSWMKFEPLHPVGLETIASRLENYAGESNPVVKKSIRIIRKRAYRQLLSARPDELGLTKTSFQLPRPSFSPSGSLRRSRTA